MIAQWPEHRHVINVIDFRHRRRRESRLCGELFMSPMMFDRYPRPQRVMPSEWKYRYKFAFCDWILGYARYLVLIRCSLSLQKFALKRRGRKLDHRPYPVHATTVGFIIIISSFRTSILHPSPSKDVLQIQRRKSIFLIPRSEETN